MVNKISPEKKLKIILLGSAYPFRGGLANYNERLIREFQNAGHDAEIFTFTVQYPSFLFPGKSQFTSDTAPNDLEISRKVNSMNPFNWISIGNEIKKRHPDILIFKYWLPFMAPCFGTIARIAKRSADTKVISILDNVLPHEKRISDKAFTNYFIKSADGFIAMSQSVLIDLKQFSKNKPAFIYIRCMIISEKKFRGKKQRENYLLMGKSITCCSLVSFANTRGWIFCLKLLLMNDSGNFH